MRSLRSLLSVAIMFGFLILSMIIVLAADSQSSFEVDSVFLKTAIKTGSSLDSQIKITNLRDSASSFEIKIIDLGEVASVETERFDLNPKETKNVDVIVSAVNISEDIYVGKIRVSSEQEEKNIPVVLEIESEDVLFDSNVNLFPRGEIFAGGKINAEIKIFDLSKIGISSIELNYFVKNFQGKTIISETESLVVDDMTSITKSFNLPEDAREGDYIFGIVLKYKNSIGTSSSLFKIEEKKKETGIESLFDNNIVYFILFFLFTIIILLIFVFYSIYSRDRFLKELQLQYSGELRRQEGYIRKRETRCEKALKTGRERRISKEIFRKIRKERRKAILMIHKGRVKKLKQLRKAKKKDEMQRQIEQWKRKGYDTAVLEKQARIPSVNEIKRQISLWKRKGYDTSVLEKK